ncbi:MAG TPA: YARHG domain-containing protein [Mucilaginibacter sp.]|nr:YARHG domain-containing protein [Mucilaginibacter sp.]
MRPLLLIGGLLVFICLQSCGDGLIKNQHADTLEKMTDSNSKASTLSSRQDTNVNGEKKIIGYWVGTFKPDTSMEGISTGEYTAWDFSNKINISIDSLYEDRVIGHSVVAGNARPFKGRFKKDGSLFEFDVREPGDDKYDGEFKFYIFKGDTILNGTWKAYQKIRVPARRYTLYKRFFKYDPSLRLSGIRYVDWTKKKSKYVKDDELGNYYDETFFSTTIDVYKFNASSDLLTKEQVSNMKKADIFILRNSIYARHGYSFKNQQLRAFFDRQPWYIPVSTDVKKELTGIEKANIELLLRFEQNAKEYYDEFGRG